MFCKLSAIENISLSYAGTYKTEFLKIKKMFLINISVMTLKDLTIIA